jgi:diguanylate cyclase (GGDEF)-like protein
MILDINHFKHYNDFWGHIKGDECLQEITRHLKDLKYRDYFVGKYGGVINCDTYSVNRCIEIAD